MRLQTFYCAVLSVLLLLCSAQGRADSAEQLFARFEPSLLQVRVLERASGAKAAIGTGFVLADPALVVTNYHVVSEAVLAPEKFQLEYLNSAQQKGALQVLAVDVINDLALVSTDYRAPHPVQIQLQKPVQGATISSLGNPHDLGGGKCADHVGSFFRHAQAEQGFGFVLTDESLRQHEVGHVGFADLGEDLFVTHDSAPEWGRFV